MEPFRNLLCKNYDYQWKPEHQKAFEGILSLLKEAPLHALASPSKDNIVILQVQEDSFEACCLTKEDKLISRSSRLLTSTEANYSSVEKQLLALIYAIDKFKLWLEPELVRVQTTCKELEKILKLVHRQPRVERKY